MRLGVDIQDVEVVAKQIAATAKQRESNVDVLRRNLKLLQELLDTAEWEYKARPDIDNSMTVTNMITTSVSLIKEIENRKDPAVVMNEVLARVIQPMLRQVIKQVTLESRRTLDTLMDTLPEGQHDRVDNEVKGLVKAIGDGLSSHYRGAVQELADALGCKPEDEKVRPMLQVVAETKQLPAAVTSD